MVVYCALYGCVSTSREDNRRFFRFPKDEIRCKQWIQVSDRPELSSKSVEDLHKSYYICDLHFVKSDHMKKRLKNNAIPTQKLPQKEIGNPSKWTQTDDFLTKNLSVQVSVQSSVQSISKSSQTKLRLFADSLRKRKLTNLLKAECKRRKCLESQLKAATVKKNKNISPHLQKLLDLQYRLKRNSRGNRYDKEFKLFALNVYFASPLAYRVLSKTLSLPSERTLRRMNINTGTKLNASVLKCLTSKMQLLTESERYCVICADEIILKRNLHYQINEDRIIGFHEVDDVQTVEPASQAFVVMARGIFSNWVQQLGYCFLAQSMNYKELNSWLDEVISKLFNIGYKVVAFVSDQGPNFMNLASERNVSVETPYFYVDGKKIHYIFDFPHLIKSLRNILMKHDFEFIDAEGANNTAKWEDIETFYKQDSKRCYRLAPILTESHIKPNNIEKKRLKYAIQIFSQSVVAAMNCSLETGQLEETAIGTIKFIGLIDKAFDIFNSSVRDSYRHKCPASKENQRDALNELERVLLNLTVLNSNRKNVTSSIKCLNGLKLSIKSIKCLSLDLQSEGINFNFTRRLNQDPWERFFESIRRQGNRRDPTPVQFSRAFSKLFMVNILKHSEQANAKDLDQLLMRADDIDNASAAFEEMLQTSDIKTNPLTVKTIDYRFQIPEHNAFVFVCGYLFKKCYEVHHCGDMVNYIAQTNEWTKFESQNLNAKHLITPPETFVEYIKSIDDQFKLFFQKNVLDVVGNTILKQLSDFSFDYCCSCFPNLYLKTLFLRFRIFNVIQFNNRQFKDKSVKSKCFSVCDIKS